jgi:C1A family cysteine protease
VLVAAVVLAVTGRPAEAQGVRPSTAARFIQKTLPRGDQVATAARPLEPLPVVDLRGALPPPGDQGKQNSCVGWAVAYALRSFLAARADGRTFAGDSIDSNHVFSPAFVYNELNGGRDDGIPVEAALSYVVKFGAAPLSLMPYDPEDYVRPAPDTARRVALAYRIQRYQRIKDWDFDTLERSLERKNPPVVVAWLKRTIPADPVSGDWPLDASWSGELHAVLLAGYDRPRRRFVIMNSWGSAWGHGGFGTVGYDALRARIQEVYVVQ